MLTTAIIRKPGRTFADGLTNANLGRPDLEKALAQHQAYGEALRRCGLEVITLEADDRYPDACFVEDTAIVTEKMATITQPGDPARLGEQGRIAEVLANYRTLHHIQLPGRIDGGDILRVGDHFYIGQSNRTNPEGARQLAELLSEHGYTSSTIPVSTVLHLKTGVTYLGKDHFIAIDEFASAFPAATTIVVDQAENYAANCIIVNGHLLIPQGFPITKRKLLDLAYPIVEIEMSEFMKMDGGLTCLSLLF